MHAVTIYAAKNTRNETKQQKTKEEEEAKKNKWKQTENYSIRVKYKL